MTFISVWDLESSWCYFSFIFQGLLTAIPLSYILPGLIFIKLDPHSLFSREKLPAIFLVVFGLAVSISGKIFCCYCLKYYLLPLFLMLSLIHIFSHLNFFYLGVIVLLPSLFDPQLDCKFFLSFLLLRILLTGMRIFMV